MIGDIAFYTIVDELQLQLSSRCSIQSCQKFGQVVARKGILCGVGENGELRKIDLNRILLVYGLGSGTAESRVNS